MAKTKVNLAKLFGNVAQELAKNQNALNQADTKNSDHGSNMVNVFNTITQAMEEKPEGSPSSQLQYASDQVRENCHSGSAAVYAEGLARAAAELQGQSVDSSNAMQLITALMGTNLGGQASAQSTGGDALGSLLGSMLGGSAGQQPATGNASADMMGSLLGSMLGAEQTPASSTGGSASGDALSSMLGGLLGGQPSSGQAGTTGEIGLEQILAAGLEFMQSQKQGQDTMSSLLDAVMAGSQAGSGYRADSGKLVAGTLMQGLSAFLGKK
ncbi:MAG: DAK2 domain-containing protein [Leptolinea sp.]|jgi:hypothetical protein|nr:DAK2 domain-containing protein [Leptolinea sp.]